MAKRTRGTTRPGQRRPNPRTAVRPSQPATRPASRPAEGLSAEEEARAAELEARIVAEERQVERDRQGSRTRTSRDDAIDRSDRVARARGQSLLAAKAVEEYAYVVRDVRRILQVGGGMVAILIGLYIVLNVAHVI